MPCASENDRPITAFFLGLVQGGVGFLHDRLHGIARHQRNGGTTNAGGYVDILSFEGESVIFYALSESFAQHHDVLGLDALVQYDELLTAIASDDIAGTFHTLE